MRRIQLSPQDKAHLLHVLRVARERFQEDAEVFQASDLPAVARTRLMEEFHRYVDACHRLSSRLDVDGIYDEIEIQLEEDA